MAVLLKPDNAAKFGIQGSVPDGFQSKTITTKYDRKDATGASGETIAWALHGKMAEHRVEVLGTSATDYTLGVATSVSGFTAAVGGTVWVVDELSVDLSNSDFAKSSISVSEYEIEA